MCTVADWSVSILLGLTGIIDWKKREIPIVLLIIISTLVLFYAICCHKVDVWYRFAGLLMGVFFFIISRVTKEAVGYADSWLILILGVHLGVLKALEVLCIASLLAAVFSVFFLWKCKWKRDVAIPFIPFLFIAYIGVIII